MSGKAILYKGEVYRGGGGGGSGTDNKTAQDETTTNEELEMLLSSVTGTTSVTDGVKKSAKAKLNPSTGNMTLGGMLTDVNGVQSVKPVYWAEYEALSPAEKNNGIIYHIVDRSASYGNQCEYEPNTKNINFCYGARYVAETQNIVIT